MSTELSETVWSIYASRNWAMNDAPTGVSPAQAIIWTNTVFLKPRPMDNLIEISIQN